MKLIMIIIMEIIILVYEAFLFMKTIFKRYVIYTNKN